MLNLLAAYPYLTPKFIDMLREPVESGKIRLLIDSGAFTAWKSGNPVKLDDYCQFLTDLPFKPWRYFMLDVIGDPEATAANYDQMLKNGFNPIPIFTRGDKPEMLERFYKTSDIVAVGGLVGTPRNKNFVRWIMDHVGDRDVHWLGFTNKNFVAAYKPFSCDSSSITSAGKFAHIELFDQVSGEWFKVNKAMFKKKPSPRIAAVIRSYDCDPQILAFKENWIGGFAASTKLSFRSHVRASIWYEKNLGVKYFLAAIALVPQSAFPVLMEAYEKETTCQSPAPVESSSVAGTAS